MTALTTASTPVLTLPPGVTLLDDNSQYTNRFDFTSDSGNVYRVAQSKSGRWWACSCPSWKYNRNGKRLCKHMEAFGLPGNYAPFEVGKLAIAGTVATPIAAPKAKPAKAAVVAPKAKPALPAAPAANTAGLKPKNVAVNGDEITVTFNACDAARVFALLASLA